MKNILTIVLVSLVAIVFAGINAFSFSKEFVPKEFTVVKASHILIPTENEAKTIKTMLDNGEDFAILARQYSTCPSKSMGGNLGYFKRGEMVKEFEKAAFSLPVGQVSEPVETRFGWHLIKVTDRR